MKKVKIDILWNWHTFFLLFQLMEENKDLQNGLTILSSVVGDQVTEVDQQLLQKTKILHQKIDASVKRLFLNASDFAPQLIQDDEII